MYAEQEYIENNIKLEFLQACNDSGKRKLGKKCKV